MVSRSLLFLSLLLLSLPSLAQQEAAATKRIQQADRLLRDLPLWEDSLASLYAAMPDSVCMKTTRDSLSRQEPAPSEFARKTDSLSQASFPRLPRELQETEARLRRQISDAKEQLAKELLPEEARQALAGEARLPDKLRAEGITEQSEKATDLESLGQQVKEEALETLSNPFEEHMDKLRKARAELAKYKGRMERVESTRDLPRGIFAINPLRGRPWQERLVLGSLWQFGRQERFLIDLGPSLAWRFTDLLSAGAGFQYRLTVTSRQRPWVSSADRVRGFYAFTDYVVKNGFFGRLYYEELNTPVPRVDALTQTETVGQEWVKGLSVGLGKNYTFYKRIKGYSAVHYNLLHARGRTPYLHPLQVKVGFHLTAGDLRGKR